jgi:hypothetical protein
MKQLSLVLSFLVAGHAFAQEIGTEITPTTPNSGVQQQQQQPQNPPPSNTNSNPPPANSGYTYKPKGSENSSSPAAKTFEGPKVSAASGDFGIRAGFGSSGSIAIPSGSGATVAAPTVGIAYFAADSFKLLIDLGFGMAITGGSPLLALSASVGFDYLFRTPGDALRPFFHFSGSFNMAGSSSFNFGFGAALGFGAEYFFNPSFSVNGRLLLSVPMAINGDFQLGLFLVTPGVGATWYF